MAQDIPDLKAAFKFLKKDEEQSNAMTPESLPTLLSVLHLPPGQRTEKDIQRLVTFTQRIKFFADLDAHQGSDAHQQCVQHMTSLEVPGGEFVFHAGDEGSRFYVILSGSVAVLAPFHRKDGKKDYNLLVVFKPGDSFGELALISNKPRAASIFTRELSHFAVLERTDYLRILSRMQDIQLTEKVELLLRHPAFAAWSRSALQRLSYFFKVVMYKRKQVVCRAGQMAGEVLLVKSGEFQLIKTIVVGGMKRQSRFRGSDSTYHSAEVTILGIGEMIGDQEVLSSAAHTYTCVCGSAYGEVMRISKEDFLKRVVTDASVSWLQDLGRLQESYRSDRLVRISRLETLKLKNKSPELIRIAEKRKGDNYKQIESARSSLKREVRRRWHMTSGERNRLEKVVSASALIPTARTVAVTRWPSKEKKILAGPPSVKHRSWLDLVKRKYFHKRGNSDGFKLLEEKSTGKLTLVLSNANSPIHVTGFDPCN